MNKSITKSQTKADKYDFNDSNYEMKWDLIISLNFWYCDKETQYCGCGHLDNPIYEINRGTVFQKPSDTKDYKD